MDKDNSKLFGPFWTEKLLKIQIYNNNKIKFLKVVTENSIFVCLHLCEKIIHVKLSN